MREGVPRVVVVVVVVGCWWYVRVSRDYDVFKDKCVRCLNAVPKSCLITRAHSMVPGFCGALGS